MSNYNYTESYGPCQTQPPCPGKVCSPLKNCCHGVHIPDFDCDDATPILTRLQEIYDYKNAFGTPATDNVAATLSSIELTNCNPCCVCTTCTITNGAVFNIESICTRVISAVVATATPLLLNINGQGVTPTRLANNLYNVDISGVNGIPAQNCVDCEKGTKTSLITNGAFQITYRLEHTICGTVATANGLCKFYAIFTDPIAGATTSVGSNLFIQNLCIPPYQCALSRPYLTLALCYDAELINPTITVTVPAPPAAQIPTYTLGGTVYIVPTAEVEVMVPRRRVILANEYIPQPSAQSIPRPCDCINTKCRKPVCPPEHSMPSKPCDCDCDCDKF